MSLEGLKQYGSDYGSSSDDGGSDDVPNSGADDDAPHEEGPVAEDERGPKKSRISSLCSPVDGNDSDSSSLHTPAQKSKRAQAFTPPRSRKGYDIPPSDSEVSDRESRDQLFTESPRGRKRGFQRVHAKWEQVASWSSQHNAEENIKKDIERILAKSLEDANTPVTPKQNAKAISHFRQKTVRCPDFKCFCFNYLDNF
jgi:hypothetical protein